MPLTSNPNGRTEKHIFGQCVSIGSGALRDITQLGVNVTPLPTAAVTLEAVSGSANDTSAGSGARTIDVHGLDANYNEIEETVTLNGTTPVALSRSFLRVFAVHTRTVGSNGVAVGTVSIQGTGGGTEYNRIAAGGNMSLQCVYTVPAGHAAYITAWRASATSAAQVVCRLRATSSPYDNERLPGVFLFQDTIIANVSNPAVFQTPLRIPAKTDIKVSGIVVGAGTGQAVASFDLFEVPED